MGELFFAYQRMRHAFPPCGGRVGWGGVTLGIALPNAPLPIPPRKGERSAALVKLHYLRDAHG